MTFMTQRDVVVSRFITHSELFHMHLCFPSFPTQNTLEIISLQNEVTYSKPSTIFSQAISMSKHTITKETDQKTGTITKMIEDRISQQMQRVSNQPRNYQETEAVIQRHQDHDWFPGMKKKINQSRSAEPLAKHNKRNNIFGFWLKQQVNQVIQINHNSGEKCN